MSKELEYVKGILEYQPLTLNNRMIIETILKKIQRLEAIENANPSEALKCLEEFEKVIEEITIGNADLRNTLKTSVLITSIKQALIKAQQQEKVLEILKSKDVDLRALKYYLERNEGIALNVYNSFVDERDKQLTQEEFELLKRWVG